MSKSKKSKKSKKSEKSPQKSNVSIDEAVEELGHQSFEDFLLSNTGMNLTQMAAILGVKCGRFYGYHARWVEEHYREEAIHDGGQG